jgi:hypothetical protein
MQSLETQSGDKLAVENDRFVLSEGGYTQFLKRSYFNCVRGGYNREAVVAHFEKLWTKVDEFVQRLQPQHLALPEMRNFARHLRLCGKTASDLEFSYRGTRSFSGENDTCSKLSSLFNRFVRAGDQLNQRLGIRQHDLDPIPQTLPPDQTIQQTIALANKCFVPTTKKTAAFALHWLTFCILSPFVIPLTIAKFIFWNPFELLLRGKITTDTPFNWAYKSSLHSLERLSEQQSRFSLYANQLLRTPIITEEHANAFASLAQEGKIEDLDLTYASVNREIGSHFIDFPILLSLLRKVATSPSCRNVEIPRRLIWERNRPEEDQSRFQAVDRELQERGFRFSERSAEYLR